MLRKHLSKLQADMLVMRVMAEPWCLGGILLIKGFKVLGAIHFHQPSWWSSQRSWEESWVPNSLCLIPGLLRRSKGHQTVFLNWDLGL